MTTRTLNLWLPLTLLAWCPMATATDYHVDPQFGSMSNDGSAVAPWSTLAAVFAASPAKTFLPGDHIYLRRGNHGTVTVTGINTADVFIEPEPGHTPVMHMSLRDAQHWYIKGLTLTGGVAIDVLDNEKSQNSTFENCYLPTGGFQVYSSNTTLRGNHIRGSGILFDFHANSGLVSGNTIEDFYSDGIHNKANNGLWENNVVMNSHKIDGNHNDLFQSLASSGNVLRGNEFRAYSDPNQADLIEPGVSDVQGIGLFDGWYEDWIIENNVVLVDHPIGIWIQGAQGCVIKNNTVARCGQNSLFASRFPNIRIATKKSGAVSTNNVVINNASERYELDDVIDNAGTSLGIIMNNVVVSKSAFTNTYLNWGKKDLHVKSGASIINAGISTNTPPTIDADGNARPFNSAWDCGAYEFGYAPSSADTEVPSPPVCIDASIVPGYGVDLHWLPSTDNRKVTGYDVFRNGLPVGRTRAGTNYLDVNADTTGSYTVQAFDHSDNKSLFSNPIGGTPPPPDNESPTIPTDVVGTPLSSTKIGLSWHFSTDNVGVSSYDIYRNGTKIGSNNAPTYTDTGLTASTEYTYTIQARDWSDNLSDPSLPALATTMDLDVTPPSVPTNVTATTVSSESIQVSWTASTDDRGVARYQISRGGEIIDSTTGTSYVDVGLTPVTSYSYTVKAVDAEGNLSADSSPPAVTTTFYKPAPVIVEESFEYAAALSISGQSGGIGWASAWGNSGTNTIMTEIVDRPMTYPGVLTNGNRAKLLECSANTLYISRTFASPIADATAATYWMAMLVRANDGLKSSYNFNYSTSAGGVTFLQLVSSPSYAAPAYKFFGTQILTGNINTNLILVKIVADPAGADTMTCYANPNLSDPTSWGAGLTQTIDLSGTGAITGFSTAKTSNNTNTNYIHFDEFRVALTWQGAVGQAISTPDDVQAPTDPTSVIATPQSTTSILVNWTASTDNVGVTGYDVYRDGALVGSPASNAFTDTGLAPSTLYTYTVKARDAAGNTSGVSADASATTQADTTAPSVPGTVAATAQSTTSIRVTWNASTDNVAVTGYELYRNNELLTGPATSPFTDTGLTPSTLYHYKIKAKDAAGNASDFSADASATTQATPVPAAVLVEESFDYAAGALAGGSGGIGWGANKWVVAGNNTVIADIVDRPMTYTDVTSKGNLVKLQESAGTSALSTSRTFENPITDTTSGTYWMAMLLRADTTMKGIYNINYNKSGGSVAFLTMVGINWTVPVYKFFGTQILSANNNTNLILIKIVADSAGSDSMTCYANPNLSDPTSWGAGFTQAIDLSGTGAITGFGTSKAHNNSVPLYIHLDEFRLATTWQGAVGQATSSADIVAPTQPANLTATAQSCTSIALTWSASTDAVGVTAYDVYRGETVVGSPATNSFTDSDLTESTLYSYTVKARDAAGNASEASTAASATTFTPVENWRKSKFGTDSDAGNGADDQDPNHNGIKNLLEYALDGDPLGHTTGIAILPKAERDPNNKLQIRFNRYTDRTDLTLTAQAADSLDGPWADLAVSALGAVFAPKVNAGAAESGTGTMRSVTVTDFYQIGDPAHPKRFIRLKAER
jgi:chitodextrinase